MLIVVRRHKRSCSLFNEGHPRDVLRGRHAPKHALASRLFLSLRPARMPRRPPAGFGSCWHGVAAEVCVRLYANAGRLVVRAFIAQMDCASRRRLSLNYGAGRVRRRARRSSLPCMRVSVTPRAFSVFFFCIKTRPSVLAHARALSHARRQSARIHIHTHVRA